MIYLDNAATTQIDPEVVEAMLPYLTEQFGNSGSIYELGRNAKDAIMKAREQVASFIGARPEQIIFTSGATEANNMVFEMTREHLKQIDKTHIVTSQIEHKSVLKSVRRLSERYDFEVSYLGVPEYTQQPLCFYLQSVREGTGLVSVMYANNEIGHVFDVYSIGRFCQENNILFHTDCVQAAGCRPINVNRIGCDFATISSHKIHGPKGVGALFIREPDKWEPMILGGDNQEYGLRGGTENVPGIVGFGKACEIAQRHTSPEAMNAIEALKETFLNGLKSHLFQHGFIDLCKTNYRPYFGTKTLNIRIDGVDAESLILIADTYGVCVSAGSACNSMQNDPSHVLTAIGLTPEQARSSIRVSFSRMNTISEVDKASAILADCIAMLLTVNSGN